MCIRYEGSIRTLYEAFKGRHPDTLACAVFLSAWLLERAFKHKPSLAYGLFQDARSFWSAQVHDWIRERTVIEDTERGMEMNVCVKYMSTILQSAMSRFRCVVMVHWIG